MTLTPTRTQVPPSDPGDHLTRDEFEHRYQDGQIVTTEDEYLEGAPERVAALDSDHFHRCLSQI